MAEFYVEKNAQERGEHLLHFSTCGALPAAAELKYLGSIASFGGAKKEALGFFSNITACAGCAPGFVEG